MSHRRKEFSLIIAIIISLLLVFCCSCSSGNDIDSQAYAYLEIFKDYFPAEEIVKYDGKYIGINLKSILYKHPQHIKKLIEDYIKEYDVSILWNNNKDKYDFQKGHLIVLEDVELTESRLETEMIYMLAPVLASTGYTYVAEKEAGQWRVTDLILNWIS